MDTEYSLARGALEVLALDQAPHALPEPQLNDLAQMAAALCGATCARICVVAGEGLETRGAFGEDGMSPRPTRRLLERLRLEGAAAFGDLANDPALAAELGLPHGAGGFWAGHPFGGVGGAPLGLILVGGAERRPDGLSAIEKEALARATRVAGAQVEALEAARARWRSESRFRTVASLVPDLLWSNGPDGAPNWFNPSWYAYTGQTPQQAGGGGWAEAVHPEDRPTSLVRINRAVEGSEPFAQQLRIRGRSGEYRWFWFRAEPLRDPFGAITEWLGVATDLDEPLAAYAALQESEQRFRAMADNAPVKVWMTDAEGRTVYLSQSWYDFAGRSPDTGLGRSWVDALHPEDRPASVAFLLECASARRTFRHEVRMRRHDGAWRWMLNVGRPRYAEDGAYLGYIGSTLDITERKQAEESLQASEERLRLALEAGAMASWEWRPNEERSIWSDSHYPMLGYAKGEVEPCYAAWAARTHPDDLAYVEARLAHTMESGEPFEAEFRLKLPNGEERWVRSQADRVTRKGEPPCMIGILVDITERRRGQEALRASEERLRLALEAGQMATWEWRPDAGELIWSEAHFRLLGLDPAQAKASVATWAEVAHPDDHAVVGDALRQTANGGPAFNCEYRVRIGDTERWIHAQARLSGEGSHARIIGVATDVTDRKRASQELAHTQENLLRISRLSAMGAMASALAHELNQPLTAVTGNLHAVMRLLGQADRQDLVREALLDATAQSLRAGEIIRRIRGFALDGHVSPEPEDLFNIVENVRGNLMRRPGASGVDFELSFNPRRIRVLVDKIQIEQVLENLLRNALEALEGCADRQISVTCGVREGSAEVRVCDTGRGFEARDPETLFRPFNSSKPSGTGLGLAICRTIIEAHGGRIAAERPAGGGAAFRLTLPLAS